MREARCALVVDFASRLTRQPDHLDAGEHRFFVAAERLSLLANPIVPKGADIATRRTARRASTRCCGSSTAAQDLPSWLTLDSTRVARADDRAARIRDAARSRAASRRRCSAITSSGDRGRAAPSSRETFAQLTDGLPLVALADIAQLADRQGIGFRDVDDAVQCYKVGVTENPWKKDYLRERIADALPFIEERVRGQHAGGDQDDRHPDALGDGAHRRAGALERQPAARRAVLRGPDGRGQDRAREDADAAHLRRRARLHPLRHERVRRGAHRRAAARRAAGLHRLRRGRRAHQRRAREAVLGRAVRRDRESASAHPRQVPADPRGRPAHRRARRDRVLLRGDPRLHVQPRHLRARTSTAGACRT